MGFHTWMAQRYLKAKKDKFLSMINAVAVVGIAIGVAALIVVIGVMSGFDHDLREKIIGANAHVLVEKETGLSSFNQINDVLKQVKGVKATTPYVHGSVFLETGTRAASLILRGIVPQSEGQVTKIDSYLSTMKIANLKPDEIVVGSQLAEFYGYEVGDQVTIIAPASGVAGQSWRFKFRIAGIFNSGMFDYDMNLVLVDLSRAQEIFHLPANTATGIGLKLFNPDDAKAIKKTIYDTAGFSFSVRTWQETNASFFAALQLEKFAMFVILTLIVLVASFNIISTLIVTVTSKVKDIGVIKAVGGSRRLIHRIFLWQGLSIGFRGTCYGFILGVGIAWALKTFHFIELPQDIYYIKYLPVLIQPMDVAMIVGSSMLISLIASIYPAMNAARLEPVDALRY